MAHDKYSNCVDIDKYGSPKNGALQKAHFAKKLWSWDFKIEFFPL